MVKNKKGGSGHKKMARKHVRESFRQRRTREAKNDEEMYARVIQLNGGGVCEIMCNDKKQRQMVIRGKFRGRNRRDNTIRINTMVLVGLRDWEILNAKKKPKVDLLEVYNINEMEQLKKFKGLNKEILPEAERVEEHGFMIDNSFVEIDEETEANFKETINKKLEAVVKKEEIVDINWDDI
jgi:translation initiation factor IF-1